MGLQFGLLARLTWWEYSWDIMEPVTYFVGYGSAIAMFGYYILTKQVLCSLAVSNDQLHDFSSRKITYSGAFLLQIIITLTLVLQFYFSHSFVVFKG